MNGPTARTIKIPLAFLDNGKYQAMMARDVKEDAGALKLETNVLSHRDSLAIELREGGGFVGRFTK
jgi:alpha-glucosidase